MNDPSGGRGGQEQQGGRDAQLVRSLAVLRDRIAAGCRAVGREPQSVTLIAVTKTYPATDVATLVRLGVTDVGESRDQEAADKVLATAALLGDRSEVSDAASETPAVMPPVLPRWHFVGRLQRRKARSVARYATAVHSLDRPELVAALADAVRRLARRPLEVFVQVSLDGDPDRGGVVAAGVPALADTVAATPELRLAGVMAVAPLDAEPAAAFAALADVAADLRRRHPGADAISAGMSGDLDEAIAAGATHVRVGTALLGRRPPVIG